MSTWRWAPKGYLSNATEFLDYARNLDGGDVGEARLALRKVHELISLAEVNIEFLNVDGQWATAVQLSSPSSRLDGLIGLEPVKREVRAISDRLALDKIRREQGLRVAPTSRHLVFTGNPGTGKTTVARILGDIYKELGVISKGQFIEVDRSGLVGQYQGHTADKVHKVVESAIGGVLFIDEAYSLSNGDRDDFGREAIDALIKLMEDHRENLVVVVAGYTIDMVKFLESNPGIKSRFSKSIQFPDYSNDELMKVLDSYCADAGLEMDDGARNVARARIEALSRDRSFGNARDVRKIFEEALDRQATRLMRPKNLNPVSGAIRILRAKDFGGAPRSEPCSPTKVDAQITSDSEVRG